MTGVTSSTESTSCGVTLDVSLALFKLLSEGVVVYGSARAGCAWQYGLVMLHPHGGVAEVSTDGAVRFLMMTLFAPAFSDQR
ncbi:MAG: hypothetical protein R2715_08985 [Ilumatobacteraceae bacterium]